MIAGNVATPEAVIDLENWGADATKVGVGPGKVRITKLKTGFEVAVPLFVETGDKIEIDTRTHEYRKRV